MSWQNNINCNLFGKYHKLFRLGLFSYLFVFCGASSAYANWQNIVEDGHCTQLLQSTPNAPTMFAITANPTSMENGGMFMVTLASKHFPRLGPGNYIGEMRFDKGEMKSPAIVQQGQNMVMVAMLMPYQHIEVLANSKIIQTKLDGRKLVDIAPEGRVQAVANLKKCIASNDKPTAKTNTQKPLVSKAIDPLDAAIAAGDRAAGYNTKNLGTKTTKQTAVNAGGADMDSFMTMFRINNRMIVNGGDFSDPQMGNVIWGLGY